MKMKLIGKDAVMAEIERIEYETNYEPFTEEVLGKRKVCKDIKDFLNTIKGKEVDFDNDLFEEVYSHLDDIKETADRVTSGNFIHHMAAIKFSANTITKVLELIGIKAQK